MVNKKTKRAKELAIAQRRGASEWYIASALTQRASQALPIVIAQEPKIFRTEKIASSRNVALGTQKHLYPLKLNG